MPLLPPPPILVAHVDLSPSEMRDAAPSAPDIVAEMISALDGGGRAYVLQKMAERFAQEIVEGVNPVSGATERFSVKTKGAQARAIAAGLLETVSLHLFQRIVRERATLWTEGSVYTYEGCGDGLASDLHEARAAGGSPLSFARVDTLGTAVGSSAALIQVLGGKLNYQPVRRDCIWIAHADEVICEDGPRAADPLSIDDASVVVIKLGVADGGNGSFAAWFGRSEKYPQGRMVQYKARQWYDVPDVRADVHAVEYWADAALTEVGNPLTIAAIDNGGGPEYPVVTWLCDTTGYGSSLMPVASGLYDQSKEIDLGASRILLSALKSARGATVLTKDVGGSNIIPDVLDEGIVVLEQGQKLSQLSHSAGNARDALAVLQQMMSDTAAAHNVPAYMVAISESAQLPSGVALAILNEPLARDRRARIEINRANVARKFEIEMALAGIENGTRCSRDAREHWEPNVREFPQDPLAQAQAWRAQIDLGISDVNEVAQEFAGLNSREEADNYLAQLTPPPAPEPPATPLGGLQARRLRGTV